MKLVEVAFFTDDVPGMVSFYQRLLGSAPIAQSEGLAMFLVGGTKVLIHERYVAQDGDLPADDHIAFGVDDVDGACAQILEQGLTLEVPPQDYPWGRSAYLRAPNGLQIEITEASP